MRVRVRMRANILPQFGAALVPARWNSASFVARQDTGEASQFQRDVARAVMWPGTDAVSLLTGSQSIRRRRLDWSGKGQNENDSHGHSRRPR